MTQNTNRTGSMSPPPPVGYPISPPNGASPALSAEAITAISGVHEMQSGPSMYDLHNTVADLQMNVVNLRTIVESLRTRALDAELELAILKERVTGPQYATREDMIKDLAPEALELAAREAHYSTGVTHYSGGMLCVCGEAWNEKTLCSEYQRLVNR